jgi:hypothetical protein
MVQDAGIPESQAMLFSGYETRAMLERYNVVSLKNVEDAGAKLDAWSKKQPAAGAVRKEAHLQRWAFFSKSFVYSLVRMRGLEPPLPCEN